VLERLYPRFGSVRVGVLLSAQIRAILVGMRHLAEDDTIKLTKALKKWLEAVGGNQEAPSVVI
jgi:hypothetical protein